MRGRLLLVHIWKLGHDQLVAVFGVITTQLNYIVVAFLNILRTPDWSKTEILSSISVELSWVESSDHSARRAVITLKAWSQRPIRLNSTQLASRVELSWVELSWVESDRKSDHSASGAVITLTTRLNSTRLNLTKIFQFLASRGSSEHVQKFYDQVSWVGSGAVITPKTATNWSWPSF